MAGDELFASLGRRLPSLAAGRSPRYGVDQQVFAGPVGSAGRRTKPRIGLGPARREEAMPERRWLAAMVLLTASSEAMAQHDLLEPAVGGQGLLTNCVLYDPSCLRAPADSFDPPKPAAGPTPLRASLPPDDQRTSAEAPVATGSVKPPRRPAPQSSTRTPRPGVVLRVKG